jgi:CheY-like chemotaxis protein
LSAGRTGQDVPGSERVSDAAPAAARTQQMVDHPELAIQRKYRRRRAEAWSGAGRIRRRRDGVYSRRRRAPIPGLRPDSRDARPDGGPVAETILVVDDDPDITRFIELNLRDAGYHVAVAGDGEEALSKIGELNPDLVVLDVMMPKLTGYDVTQRLRASDETKRIPVILLTARVQEADVARGFEVGADDYMKKPFSPQELRARVQAILGRR